MELPFRIPDSLLPVLLGLGLWFFVCYVFVAPELTERAIAMHVESECTSGANPNICSCVLADIKTGTGAVKNAVFLSTFGLSEPRVRFWNNDQNPYIQYVSLEMNNQSRRNTCDAPMLDAIAQAEIDAQKNAAIKIQKALDLQQKKYEEAMEQQRQAGQQLVEDTKKQLKDVTEDTTKHMKEVAEVVMNSPLGDEIKDRTAQAKRVYDLQDKTGKEVLNWWELALKRSEKMRHKMAERYRR